MVVEKEVVKSNVASITLKTKCFNLQDTLGSVNEDIENFSYNFVNSFNVDLINFRDFFFFYSSDIILISSIVLSLTFLILIIFFERYNGVLISSVIFLTYSFILYLFNSGNNLNLSNWKIFKNCQIFLNFDSAYIICFILGFVLLLIYISKLIRNLIKEIKHSMYGWR